MNTVSHRAQFNAETLLVHCRRMEQLKGNALHMPSALLESDVLCHLELLLNRGYFPLQGFMGREDYDAVLDRMALADGTFWPMPVTVPVPAAVAKSLEKGAMLALRDQEGFMLAVLFVEDLWQPDLSREAMALHGTCDPAAHPEVAQLLQRQDCWYVGGRVEGLHLPQHFDFTTLRHTPAQLHRQFTEQGWKRVIGYQSCTPLHAMHREMLLAAALEADAKLLLCPTIHPARLADVEHFSLVRCHELFVRHLPKNLARINLIPLPMPHAGIRGALLQAMVLRNYGCSHVLWPANTPELPETAALRTLAGLPDQEQTGEALDARREVLDIVPMRATPRVYVQELGIFVQPEEVKPEMTAVAMDHAQVMLLLQQDAPVPEWASTPDVLEELRRAMPPRSRQGFTLFLTGLSGAGKSTLAKVLYVKLSELQDRPVTLLDGDVVRRNLSSELGFHKEHRDLNVRRIGFVASEITKNRGIAICAPIAPYAQPRADVRSLISCYGGFVEIFMATPLEVCEQRDRKSLYAKARAGIIKGVTGVDDPYEIPEHPELIIDTTEITPVEAAARVIDWLVSEGYLQR